MREQKPIVKLPRKPPRLIPSRKKVQTLQRAGISTVGAEALLQRMQDKVDGLCQERDRLVGESRMAAKGRRTYAGTDKVILGTPASRRV